MANGQTVKELPDDIECRQEVGELLKYINELQRFVLSISNGELSAPFNYKGPLAGSLKTLQANLRHLTWQPKMIAEGDLYQHVDFMGEFSTSFNTMVKNLRDARSQLQKKNDELKKLNQELQEDLALAAEAQSTTMHFQKESSFLKSALLFRPYSKVSGDFYDEFTDEEGTLNFFLGDATGHGTSAALITMLVKMGLNTLPRNLKTEEVLRQLNKLLASCIPEGKFVTGIYLRITSNGMLTFSNAAHPPLLIFPAKKDKAAVINGSGLALGMFEKEIEPYDEHRYQLQPGDRIFVYTDGITECYKGDELFGIAKLTSFLENNKSSDLDTILSTLFEKLKQFTEGYGFHDDMIMIGLQYL